MRGGKPVKMALGRCSCRQAYGGVTWMVENKRVVDVLGSAIALSLASPIFLVLALVVRMRLGSPILFRQTRPGLNGQPFIMVKFRTMTDARDTEGNLQPDEVRMTRFGKFLRSTSLDELPELWNILRGDMSLVGPRPLLMDYLPLYTAEQRRRHNVRPGLTGWAQINGRNALSWDEKFALDVWYVDNQNFWLDVKILWRTVRQVFLRKGISAEGQATMSPFRGSR